MIGAECITVHHFGVGSRLGFLGHPMSIHKKQQEASFQERSVRASISFPEAQYSILEKIAAEHRVSLAWVVRDAVDGYLKARWPLLAAGLSQEETEI